MIGTCSHGVSRADALPTSSCTVIFASAKPLFGRQSAVGKAHGIFVPGAAQSVEDGSGLFAVLVKVVTTVSPVGAMVAVGCIVTCGEMMRSPVKGPSGLRPVANPVAVR